MVKFIGCLFAMVTVLASHGQVYNPSPVASTTFFSEFLYSSAILSVNVDRIFLETDAFKFSYRAGVGLKRSEVAIPLGVSALREVGFGSYLEVGVGYTPDFFISRFHNLRNSFNGRLGFRRQKAAGGFFWHVAALYIVMDRTDLNQQRQDFSFSVGIGYTLPKHWL